MMKNEYFVSQFKLGCNYLTDMQAFHASNEGYVRTRNQE